MQFSGNQTRTVVDYSTGLASRLPAEDSPLSRLAVPEPARLLTDNSLLWCSYGTQMQEHLF